MLQASMPMYDWPELRAQTDAWWAALAVAFEAEGIEGVPRSLLHDVPVQALWGAPDLLFSQTCGYPLTHEWAGRLQTVATPHYAAEGCDGSDYCSFLVVRRADALSEVEDLRGRTAAVNDPMSQSGYSALRTVVAPLARQGVFFGHVVESGSHLASLEAVHRGDADICAVDAVVWALARRHRPVLTGPLVELGVSPMAPGLPYVTRPETGADTVTRLRAGLEAAFADPALADIREALLLDGMSTLEPGGYDRIIELESEAVRYGYPIVS